MVHRAIKVESEFVRVRAKQSPANEDFAIALIHGHQATSQPLHLPQFGSVCNKERGDSNDSNQDNGGFYDVHCERRASYLPFTSTA
jgi:hypothetical protein